MGTVDVYRITDQLDEPTLEVMVTRLEGRGKHPRFVAMTEEYLDAMAIDSARTVVDLGCGTGVVARAIARRPGFKGKVTGIDRSAFLVSAAQRLAAAEGLASRVEFRAGDSHTLGLKPATFDAVVAHTLISHVEDPAAVLREIAQVLKPGGLAGIFDGDYASITYTGGDPERDKIQDERLMRAIVTNPRVMRMMPELLRDAGLELVASFAHVVADIGKADFTAPALQSFLRLLPKSGAMTAAEAQAWVDGLMQRSERGVYFASTNFFSYVARRAT